jgi:hypothetical protein
VGHHHRAIQSYSQNVHSIYEGQKGKGFLELVFFLKLLFTIFAQKELLYWPHKRHESHEGGGPKGPGGPPTPPKKKKKKKKTFFLSSFLLPIHAQKNIETIWRARVSWSSSAKWSAHTLELQWRMHTNRIHTTTRSAWAMWKEVCMS